MAVNLVLRFSPTASKGVLARFDKGMYMRHHIERYNSKTIFPNNFVESIFEVYYGGLDPNSIVPVENVNSATSFMICYFFLYF